MRHRAVVSAVYELPFLRGKSIVDKLLGGWKTGLLANFQAGPPFTVTNLTDTTNAFPAGGLRPDLIGDPALDSGRSNARWFNTDAFRAPAQYRFGTSPRSVLRGPGIVSFDLSLLKNFSITERLKAEFRGEALQPAQPRELRVAWWNARWPRLRGDQQRAARRGQCSWD